RLPRSSLFPYTTLFRSYGARGPSPCAGYTPPRPVTGHRGGGARPATRPPGTSPPVPLVPLGEVLAARRGLVGFRPEVRDRGYAARAVPGEEGKGGHLRLADREPRPGDHLVPLGDDPLDPQVPVARILAVEPDVALPAADPLPGLGQDVHDVLGQRGGERAPVPGLGGGPEP